MGAGKGYEGVAGHLSKIVFFVWIAHFAVASTQMSEGAEACEVKTEASIRTSCQPREDTKGLTIWSLARSAAMCQQIIYC